MANSTSYRRHVGDASLASISPRNRDRFSGLSPVAILGPVVTIPGECRFQCRRARRAASEYTLRSWTYDSVSRQGAI
jgi:hypothetical protein